MSTRINITIDSGGLLDRNAQQTAANRQAKVLADQRAAAEAEGVERRAADRIAAGLDPLTGLPASTPSSASTINRLDQEPAANRRGDFPFAAAWTLNDESGRRNKLVCGNGSASLPINQLQPSLQPSEGDDLEFSVSPDSKPEHGEWSVWTWFDPGGGPELPGCVRAFYCDSAEFTLRYSTVRIIRDNLVLPHAQNMIYVDYKDQLQILEEFKFGVTAQPGRYVEGQPFPFSFGIDARDATTKNWIIAILDNIQVANPAEADAALLDPDVPKKRYLIINAVNAGYNFTTPNAVIDELNAQYAFDDPQLISTVRQTPISRSLQCWNVSKTSVRSISSPPVARSFVESIFGKVGFNTANFDPPVGNFQWLVDGVAGGDIIRLQKNTSDGIVWNNGVYVLTAGITTFPTISRSFDNSTLGVYSDYLPNSRYTNYGIGTFTPGIGDDAVGKMLGPTGGSATPLVYKISTDVAPFNEDFFTLFFEREALSELRLVLEPSLPKGQLWIDLSTVDYYTESTSLKFNTFKDTLDNAKPDALWYDIANETLPSIKGKPPSLKLSLVPKANRVSGTDPFFIFSTPFLDTIYCRQQLLSLGFTLGEIR
jgi:hypothetical protein